jgi:hypothetical protein
MHVCFINCFGETTSSHRTASRQLRDQAWPDRRDRAWALRDGALRRVFHGGVFYCLAYPHKFFSLTGKT